MDKLDERDSHRFYQELAGLPPGISRVPITVSRCRCRCACGTG
jgi:hypothetical protein